MGSLIKEEKGEKQEKESRKVKEKRTNVMKLQESEEGHSHIFEKQVLQPKQSHYWVLLWELNRSYLLVMFFIIA